MKTSEQASLTGRQRQILDFVSETVKSSGMPPTRAEIARGVGYRSPNAADEQLRAMERKGAIEIVVGASRGIRLKPAHASQHPSDPLVTAAPATDVSTVGVPLVESIVSDQPLARCCGAGRRMHVAANLFPQQPDCFLPMVDMGLRDAGILAGDLLAVRIADEVHDGQIAVVQRSGRFFARRVWRTSFGCMLVPDNPDLPHMSVAIDELGFRIEGMVIGMLRREFDV